MASNVTLIYLLLLIIQFCSSVNSQGCEGQKFGPSDLTKYTSNLDSESGFGLLSTSATFRVNCCGVIKRWKAYGKSTGSVEVNVWRPLDNGQYQLKGKTNLKLTSANNIVNVVQTKNIRISVEPGDFIGFYNPGAAVIPYGTGSGSNMRQTMASPSKNAIIDWSTASSASGRIYAFGAIGGDNTKPSFKNLPSTVDLHDPVIGSSVFVVEGDDADRYDIPDLQYIPENTSPYFELNPSTRQVIMKTAAPVGTYKLSIRVADHCGASAKSELTLNVLTPATEPEPSSEPEPTPQHLWVAGVVLAILALAAILVVLLVLDHYHKMPMMSTKTKPEDEEKSPRNNKPPKTKPKEKSTSNNGPKANAANSK